MTINISVSQFRWPFTQESNTDAKFSRPPSAAWNYDLFVGTVGYESRAGHVLKLLGDRLGACVGATYPTNRVHSFDKNLKLFLSAGGVVDGTLELTSFLRKFVTEWNTRESLKGPRIAIDISSMSRDRLADVVRTLLVEVSLTEAVTVDWIYTPARFTRRLLETGPVRHNDAIPGFEGWGDPDRPLFALVGLGLEGSVLYGVLDDVEPSDSWSFQPYGVDDRYDERVSKNNSSFLSSLNPQNKFAYDVMEPYSSFLKLAGVLNELSKSGRIILLPLGPKIFSLMSLVLGSAYRRDVAVWRLSADPAGLPVDRVAAEVPPVGLTTMSTPNSPMGS